MALAECAMKSGAGVEIALDSPVRPSALLFGESTGRALVSFSPGSEAAVAAACDQRKVPLQVIGRVGGERLRIAIGGRTLIDEAVSVLRDRWSTAFAKALESADVL